MSPHPHHPYSPSPSPSLSLSLIVSPCLIIRVITVYLIMQRYQTLYLCPPPPPSTQSSPLAYTPYY